MSSLALVIFFAIPFFLLQNIAAVFGGKLLEGRSKTIRGQPVKRSLMHESQAENQCNSRQLEKIMAQNILPNDVVGSKLHIMRAAKKQIGGSFNVICARGNFSYITSTRIYCLVERRGVKCFSFLSESKRRQQQKVAAAGIN